MDKVYFNPTDQYIEIANTIFDEQNQRLSELIPGVDIQHIGSTAIPGTITKGDLDINVRVTADQFNAAIEVLKNNYQVNQPQNWSNDFASFNDAAENKIDVGIQLTIVDSNSDDFVILRDKLKADPELIKKYNYLKKRYEGLDMDGYRKEKAKFFENLRH